MNVIYSFLEWKCPFYKSRYNEESAKWKQMLSYG